MLTVLFSLAWSLPRDCKHNRFTQRKDRDAWLLPRQRSTAFRINFFTSAPFFPGWFSIDDTVWHFSILHWSPPSPSHPEPFACILSQSYHPAHLVPGCSVLHGFFFHSTNFLTTLLHQLYLDIPFQCSVPLLNLPFNRSFCCGLSLSICAVWVLKLYPYNGKLIS